MTGLLVVTLIGSNPIGLLGSPTNTGEYLFCFQQETYCCFLLLFLEIRKIWGCMTTVIKKLTSKTPCLTFFLNFVMHDFRCLSLCVPPSSSGCNDQLLLGKALTSGPYEWTDKYSHLVLRCISYSFSHSCRESRNFSPIV